MESREYSQQQVREGWTQVSSRKKSCSIEEAAPSACSCTRSSLLLSVLKSQALEVLLDHQLPVRSNCTASLGNIAQMHLTDFSDVDSFETSGCETPANAPLHAALEVSLRKCAALFCDAAILLQTCHVLLFHLRQRMSAIRCNRCRSRLVWRSSRPIRSGNALEECDLADPTFLHSPK